METLPPEAMGVPLPPRTVTETLGRARGEILATPGGLRLLGVLRDHTDEIRALVMRHRRVATIWHRRGGPALLQGGIRGINAPASRLPPVIDGRPLGECLRAILGAFRRYGSTGLAEAVRRHGEECVELVSLSYGELLDRLRGGAPA